MILSPATKILKFSTPLLQLLIGLITETELCNIAEVLFPDSQLSLSILNPRMTRAHKQLIK